MKKNIILTYLLFLPFFAFANNLKIFTVRADYWCPYNCLKTDKEKGFGVEILEKVLEKLGMTMDYETINWARSIIDTRDGKYDAIIGASKDDAPDFVFPKNELATPKSCFYANLKNKSAWKYDSAKKDFGKMPRVGIIKEYAYFKEFDDYIKDPKNKNNIEEHFGDEVQYRALQKIIAGRMGVFIENDLVVNYIMNKHKEQLKTITSVGCEAGIPVYVAFSPKKFKADSPELKKYDEVVNEMKKNGELDKIYSKYGIKQ